MFTVQGLMLKTEYMMEQIHRTAVEYTVEKFREAARRYYTQGYDNGETVKLIHELEELGVSPDETFELDWQIREEVYGNKEEADVL